MTDLGMGWAIPATRTGSPDGAAWGDRRFGRGPAVDRCGRRTIALREERWQRNAWAPYCLGTAPTCARRPPMPRVDWLMDVCGPQHQRPADRHCSCRTLSAATLGLLAGQPWVAALVASRVVGVEVDEAALIWK